MSSTQAHIGDRMRRRLNLSSDQLEAFCQRWKIAELAVFGSALREDFDAESDIDLLVSFAADAEWSLLDHVRMTHELEDMTGRGVDLMTRPSVEESRNWIRRKAILEAARPVYESR
jgi:hypothetical protein